MTIEQHLLTPFLPANARVLMLGSFPPSQKRWSMNFYYPNWLNDMWRIFGSLFFNDPNHFCVVAEKRFDKDRLVAFLNEKGFALSDTAQAVTRLKDNASDKFLQVEQPMDVAGHLRKLPQCRVVVVTGEKAAGEFCKMFAIEPPVVGEYTSFIFEGRDMRLYRMPSSSRAYPRPLDYKASFYKIPFTFAGVL